MADRRRRRAGRTLHRRLHRWAGVLRERGVASLLEAIIGRARRLPRAVLAAGRRRAAADRPPPRRASCCTTPPRRGQLGVTALARLAAPSAIADDGARRRRRGAQPAARVRRRGGAGADDPPQQGPRVPDRLLPVPVGSGLDRPRSRAGRLPRPRRRRTSARSTSALEGRTYERAPALSTATSSAARTCASPTSR